MRSVVPILACSLTHRLSHPHPPTPQIHTKTLIVKLGTSIPITPKSVCEYNPDSFLSASDPCNVRPYRYFTTSFLVFEVKIFV